MYSTGSSRIVQYTYFLPLTRSTATFYYFIVRTTISILQNKFFSSFIKLRDDDLLTDKLLEEQQIVFFED